MVTVFSAVSPTVASSALVLLGGVNSCFFSTLLFSSTLVARVSLTKSPTTGFSLEACCSVPCSVTSSSPVSLRFSPVAKFSINCVLDLELKSEGDKDLVLFLIMFGVNAAWSKSSSIKDNLLNCSGGITRLSRLCSSSMLWVKSSSSSSLVLDPLGTESSLEVSFPLPLRAENYSEFSVLSLLGTSLPFAVSMVTVGVFSPCKGDLLGEVVGGGEGGPPTGGDCGIFCGGAPVCC